MKNNIKQLKKLLKKFYEEVGEKYPEETLVYNTLHGKLRKKFVFTYLQKFKGSLLDIGCNRGMYLDEYNGGDRFGIDLSLNVLKNIVETKTKHLIVADAEQLQCFKENAFDNVLCSEVLEHCLNPLAVFQGIAHVLNSTGYALLTTPNYKKFKPEWIELGSLNDYDISIDNKDGFYHTAYQPEELVEFAKNVSLEIVEFGTLEKEVKYAAKIPAAIFLFEKFINRFFQSHKFDQINHKFFVKSTLLFYNVCHITGLEKILLRFVNEGVRSYVLMKKSQNN